MLLLILVHWLFCADSSQDIDVLSYYSGYTWRDSPDAGGGGTGAALWTRLDRSNPGHRTTGAGFGSVVLQPCAYYFYLLRRPTTTKLT